MKDWDLPLLNQNKSHSLFSTALVTECVRQQLQSMLTFHAIRRISELRRSCGVEPELTTVRVNIPPRYRVVAK